MRRQLFSPYSEVTAPLSAMLSLQRPVSNWGNTFTATTAVNSPLKPPNCNCEFWDLLKTPQLIFSIFRHTEPCHSMTGRFKWLWILEMTFCWPVLLNQSYFQQWNLALIGIGGMTVYFSPDTISFGWFSRLGNKGLLQSNAALSHTDQCLYSS